MSRKQKLIYSLIGLVVLLVVLFVVSKLVAWRERAIGDITTQTNEAGTITIGVMNPSLITDMSWTYEGETYSMEYRSGVWDKVTDVAFPVNQTVLSDMTSAISSLTANQGIPNVSDMEPYGLVVPSMTIKIKADNERLTYKIGDKNELTGEYYLQLNTLSTVYLVDADIVETFSKGLFEIMQVETVPEYGTTASATIENANGTIQILHEKTDDGERWYLDDENQTLLDSSAASKLVNYGLGVSWLDCDTYQATEYYLESCGLTEPRAKITLTDTDGNSFTLVFGNETEGGTLAQFEGSDIVYVVGTDTADYLANATVESLLPAQTDEAA